MYHFKYVTKTDTAPVKREIIELIHLVQDEIRDQFTFQFMFIGSESRNMVTYDPTSNIGFDFDVNLIVNDDDEEFSAEEIKKILMNGFNKHTYRYKYDFCEDSTRVFTIKVKDRQNSRILHSCDFAIIYDCSDGRQQYIRYNKPSYSYSWEYQAKGFYELPKKIDYCRQHNLNQAVRELYLFKKNNSDLSRKSRELFAETIHQICQQNGYYS